MKRKQKAEVILIAEQCGYVWACVLPGSVRYAWKGGRKQAQQWADEYNNETKENDPRKMPELSCV